MVDPLQISRPIALAFRRTHTWADADDLMQEAAIAAIKASREWNGLETEGGYIAYRCQLALLHYERAHGPNARVGRNRWVARAEPAGNYQEERDHGGRVIPVCDAPYDEAELVQAILDCRCCLTRPQFRTLVLVALGFECREIARMDGTSDRPVHSRLRVARRALEARIAA